MFFGNKRGFVFLILVLSLTLLSGFCLADEGIVLSYAPHFKIYFNENLNAPMLGSETSGDLIYDFVAEVRSALVNAYESYAEAPGTSKGFKLPEETEVYVDDWGPEKTAEWDWMTKNIEIPVTYSSLRELQHDVAHELFHAVQNQYSNFISMNSSRWWMEATADYAAAYIGTNHGLQSELPLNFIKSSLNSDEERHMYLAAHFIKYLAGKGINFRDLFIATMNSDQSVLRAINSHLNNQGSSLSEVYNEFVLDFIMGYGVKREKLDCDIAAELCSYAGEYTEGSLSASTNVNAAGNYAAEVVAYKITGSKDTPFTVNLSAIEPTAGIQTQYLIASANDRNSILRGGNLEAGKPVEEKLLGGYYVYFVVTNAAEEPGYVTVAIEKMAGMKSVIREREAGMYNGNYSATIGFTLFSSHAFQIINEQTLKEGGEYYRLTLDLVDEIQPGKNAVIQVQANLSDLKSEFPERSPFFKETYWYAGGKVPGNSAKLVIPADPPNPGRLVFSVVIYYTNANGEEYYGGGATVIDIVIMH